MNHQRSNQDQDGGVRVPCAALNIQGSPPGRRCREVTAGLLPDQHSTPLSYSMFGLQDDLPARSLFGGKWKS